jgi:hypothetical protein
VEHDDGAALAPAGMDIDEATVLIGEHDVRQARSDVGSGRKTGVGLSPSGPTRGHGAVEAELVVVLVVLTMCHWLESVT